MMLMSVKQALELDSWGFELGPGSYWLWGFGQVWAPSKPTFLPIPGLVTGSS